MLPLLLLLLDRQAAHLCKEEPPAQAGGFLFSFRNAAQSVGSIRCRPASHSTWNARVTVAHVVPYGIRQHQNDYIADLSMQRIGLKLIVITTTLHVPPRMRFQ
jgi:hypothetical protein